MGDTDSELLAQILKQLQVTRNIPSTALRLKHLAVEDSADHIRSDARFTAAQVVLHNIDCLLLALGEASGETGLVAEFGVYRGRTLTAIAKRYDDRTVHGFDSFVGLPEKWSGSKEAAGAFNVGGTPPTLPVDNTEFHIGWFDATVPEFARATRDSFRFVHMDADLYSSTATVFNGLRDRFVPGTVIVFDEYFGYHGWRLHEHKAFMEFLDVTGFTFEALAVGHMNLAVRLLAP